MHRWLRRHQEGNYAAIAGVVAPRAMPAMPQAEASTSIWPAGWAGGRKDAGNRLIWSKAASAAANAKRDDRFDNPARCEG